jgi:hypothetical protein
MVEKAAFFQKVHKLSGNRKTVKKSDMKSLYFYDFFPEESINRGHRWPRQQWLAHRMTSRRCADGSVATA